MKDINKIILAGRLGADPVRRETKQGNVVVYFPLATSRRTREGENTGEFTEVTQWHRVTVWGRAAEYVLKHLKKGYSALVEGSVRSHPYQTKDGETRVSFEIHATVVSLLSAPLRMVHPEAESDEEDNQAEDPSPLAVNE